MPLGAPVAASFWQEGKRMKIQFKNQRLKVKDAIGTSK
jgi:hypothetical protein